LDFSLLGIKSLGAKSPAFLKKVLTNFDETFGWALGNIIEQCVEFQQSLSINFMDFKKAFDSEGCNVMDSR